MLQMELEFEFIIFVRDLGVLYVRNSVNFSK